MASYATGSGDAEDRFFATVFLGTALLFVAMLFVAAAVAGGLLAAEARRGTAGISPEVWRFGRHVTYLVLTVYGMRMAGAFTMIATTIGVRFLILPRWLAIFGWTVGIVLLLTNSRSVRVGRDPLPAVGARDQPPLSRPTDIRPGRN